MTTLHSALNRAICQLKPHVDLAQLDSEVLLAHVIHKNRSYLRAWHDKSLSAAQLSTFQQLINQREKGIPIAYLTQQREFWSREFKVCPDVLIPRPETELLIELCLAQLPTNKACNILDLGTGSGIIAITLAAERPLAKVIACDYSQSALAIAKDNAQLHAIDNIIFYHSDWFKAIPHQSFDIIVSNPPYIASDDIHLTQGDVRFEPRCALIASEQGLGDIKTIIENAAAYLTAQGQVFIEHGYNQQLQVQAIFQQAKYAAIMTYTDLAHLPRVTAARKSG